MLLGSVVDVWFAAAEENEGSVGWRGGKAGDGAGRAGARASSPPLTPADAALVERLRLGEDAAFDTLFRTYFPRLVDFAAATVRERAVAEELAADVFLSVWRRRESWAPRGSIAAYLYRAVRNLAQNHVRDRHAEQVRVATAAAELSALATDAEGPGIGGLGDREARIAAVWRAVDQLPETRRAVVHLRWRGNLSFEEIAILLGTSPAAVKMQLSRALKTVRGLLPEAFD